MKGNNLMTYDEAWKLTSQSSYQQALDEGWGDEWLSADDHIHVTNYDLQAGIISDVTEYDD